MILFDGSARQQSTDSSATGALWEARQREWRERSGTSRPRCDDWPQDKRMLLVDVGGGHNAEKSLHRMKFINREDHLAQSTSRSVVPGRPLGVNCLKPRR